MLNLAKRLLDVVGPEFSSQLIMLKESICKIIICRHEPGYFFRDLLSTAAESSSTVDLDLNRPPRTGILAP